MSTAATDPAIAEVIALFQNADANGDGTLSFDELRNLLLTIGTPAGDIPAIFASCDTNSDGVVSYEEFVQWTWDLGNSTQETLLGTAGAAKRLLRKISDQLSAAGMKPDALFASYDTDGNGFLNRDEFYQILLRFDQSITVALLDEAFGQIDDDRNGWLTQDEFRLSLETGSFEAVMRQRGIPTGAPGTFEMQVTMPPGAVEGQLIEIYNEGQYYHVPAPGGLWPGQTFNVTLQKGGAVQSDWAGAPAHAQTVDVQVVVPAGLYAGQLMSVDHQGLRYEIPVPAGCYPGVTVSVQLPA